MASTPNSQRQVSPRVTAVGQAAHGGYVLPVHLLLPWKAENEILSDPERISDEIQIGKLAQRLGTACTEIIWF